MYIYMYMYVYIYIHIYIYILYTKQHQLNLLSGNQSILCLSLSPLLFHNIYILYIIN